MGTLDLDTVAEVAADFGHFFYYAEVWCNG